MELFHPTQEGLGQVIGGRHGVRAGFRGNDRVAPRRVKAKHRLFGGSAGGQGSLVPVAVRGIHSENRRDFRLNTGNTAKTVFHLLPLGSQGGFITHMAACTSAAAGIGRTIRSPPIRGNGIGF